MAMRYDTNIAMMIINYTGVFIEPRIAKNDIISIREVNNHVANSLLITLDCDGNIHNS